MGELKFSGGLRLCAHTQTRAQATPKKLLLLLLFLRKGPPLQHEVISYLLMRFLNDFSKVTPVFFFFPECQSAIRAPILKLNGFRLKAEWSHLSHVHQRQPETSVRARACVCECVRVFFFFFYLKTF